MKLSLIFDGGSLGNPGKGYGSFQLSIEHEPMAIEELDFGDQVTNNQAEYGTLIEGLRRAIEILKHHNRVPQQATIEILTDSKLVVEQVNGRWKVKNDGLKPLCAEARALLNQFGNSHLSWHPRKESVKVLGH